MIQVSRYSSINFDNDWKLRFQIQADYCQKFATTDKPRVQYVLSADSLLKPFIEVNGVVTQQESLTLNQTDDFIVKEVVLNLASIQPGSEVLLFFAENDSSVHELESLFLVTDETDDTVLIEYTNRRNEFDTIFSTNSLFQFRVEGAFLPQDYTFESQSENFRDQRHVAKTLSGYPIEKKTLSLGGGFGVPRWVASLINNIFSLSNVYVNGDRMVRDEGGSVEMTLLHNDYPLYIYKITLEKSDDITADLVALFRAVDSKKKVARSSGEDIRVYNEFAKSLGISDSKMIRELSTIEEISKNFYIEIDDGSSSNTGKATLALLQKFIFEGWINQPVRTSDDVKFRSVVSSNYKEKNNGWSIDATGISEFADLFLRGVFEVMGDSVFHGDIKSHDYATGALGAGYGLVKDSNGDSLLEVDRLLVRKIAYFVELVIQRMSHVGGQIVLTPASMKCIRVEEFDDYYRCYFESTDGDKTLTNDFVVSDQARCQTFNIKTGTSQNVSNSYYWRLVVGVGDDYIDLSKADCDAGSTVPQADDEIVLLGNRTDATRQSAIVLASYGNDAPYFKLYRGIDSYQLSGKEFLSFSRSQIKMIADELYFSTGESVSTVINGVKADLEETKTEFQGKIDTVDSKVEGIQIGVRNLAPKTKITNDAGATINGYEYTFSAQNTDGLTLNKDIFELNEEYVLSFRMRVNSGTLVNIGGHQAGFSVNNFEINGTKPGGTWQGGIEGGLDTENLIIAHVRKTSDEGNIGLWIQPNRFAGTIVNVTISEISVVKGNKYVGWSPAPEDLEAAAQEAKDLADAAQAAADAADAKADNAQTAADAAKDRLDDWAADSVISPTEKQGLKDEIARIDGDKSEITANYTKYGLGMPTAYNSAHSAYRAVLVTLSASTPETIAIPSDFSTKQVAYYTARTNALTAIAEKAKQVADAAQDAADAAQEAADNAMDKYNNLQIGVRNLLLKSNVEISKQETSMGSYIYSEHLSKGKEYTLTLCYTLGANVTSIGACLVPGGINMSFTTHGEKVVEQKSYTIPEDAGVLSGCMFYQYGATDSKIHWAVLVEGNKAPMQWIAAPEDLEAAAQEAKDLADAAQAAADAADAKADNAQTAADAAKDRLDDWAADSVISPTEKQGLKDEIARIDGDKSEITANYTKYGLGMPTAYNSAHSAYRAVLVTLSASTPETIAIPSDFSTKQVAYYTARTNALTAIAEKAKQVADAAQDAADAAQEAADNAMDKYNNLQIGVRNLLLKSNVEISKQETSMGSYIYSEHLSKGKEYTLTLCYTLGANVTSIGACLVPGGINMSFTTHGEKVVEQKSYTIPEDAGVLSGCMFYQYGATDSKIHWAVLVEGNKAPMQWIAAPEDMEEQLQTVSGTVTTLGSELTNTKVALESYKDKVEEKFTAAATATEEQIENAVLNLQKGMRNLVQQGMFNATGLTDYNAKNLYLTKDLVEGEKYTIVIKATLRGSQVLRIYEQSSQITLGTFIASDFTGGVSKARVITYKPYSDSTMRDVLRLYNYPSSGSAANPMDLEWVCLYEGDIKDTAPDYFVNAPEDLNLEINSVKQSVSAIEQTAENISLRVTTTETKVTTAQNTADAAQAAADNAQSSADSALDAANDAINASNSGKLYVKGTGYNVGGAGVNPPRQVILNNNGVNIAIPTARGMNLITLNRSDLSVGYNLNYDYTTSQVNSLIERLNSLTDNVIVILTSKDSFGVQGDTLTNLLEATSRCGGSGNAAAFDSRVPYALVGIPGIGKGAGIEMFTSSLNTAPAAEISTQIINGIPVGISTQAKNMLEEAKDYTADRTLPTWRGWIDVTQDDDGNPLDENKYYPLTIRLSNRDYTNIRLKVNLNSGTKPSWATHNNGFTVNCEWNAIGSGWGVNPSPLREIIEYSRAFTNTETLKIDNEDVTRTIEPVASIGQLGHYNYEYIYLRGGGKYYFEIQGITYNGSRTEIAAQDIQLHTTTFVPNSLDPDYKIEVLTPEDITIIERTNVTKTEYTAGINNLADKVELYATKKLTFKDGTQEVVDAGNLQVGFDAINGYVGHYDASTGKWNKSGFMVKDSYSGIFSGKANSQDSAIVEVLSSVEVYGDTAAISAAHVVITGETKFVTKGGSGSVVNIFSDKAFSYISGSTHQEVFNINNGVFAVSDYGDVHIGKYSSGGAGILYNYNTSTLSLRGSINITSGSININNGVFKVTNTGAMTATSGKIGGFTIDGTWLRGDNGLSISDELVNINKTDRSVYIGGHPDESVGGKSKLGYFRMTNSPNNIKSGHAISLYCAAPYLTTNVSSESLGSFAFWADGESVLTGLTFWGKYSGATSGTVTITNYDSALYINGDVTLQDGSGLKTSRFSHFILIVNTSSSKRFVRGLVNNGQMTILGYCCKFVVFYGGNFYGISDEY